MITREEFQLRFRGRMLVFLTEAWAVRQLQPSQLGLVMDKHARELRGLLNEVYDALTPKLEEVFSDRNGGHTAGGGS